jgi:hypothetical protein
MDAWLDRLRIEITEATANLQDSDWRRAPAGRWNSAEIVEHLARSYSTTAKMLELILEAGGPPQVRPASVTEFLLKLLIVQVGIFPSGAKSPSMVCPKGDPGPVALKQALSNLNRMDAAIAAAAQHWGSDVPIAMHPRLGPLNPAQWRKFHYIHGHHHILQIRKRLETGEQQSRGGSQ